MILSDGNCFSMKFPRLYLCILSSPSQISSFLKFAESRNYQNGHSYFFILRFNFQEQSSNEVHQYNNAIKKIQSKYFIFVNEKYFAFFFKSIIRICSKFQTVNFVIGTTVGFYSWYIFEKIQVNKITIVDDGISILLIEKLVIKNGRKNIRFFSKYSKFIQKELLDSKTLHAGDTPLNKSETLEFLGVFGSPIVELEVIDIFQYEQIILKIATIFGANNVLYFMHRKERKKFSDSSISEITSETMNSIELIRSMKVLPRTYWTMHSSALIDMMLVTSDPKFQFFFTSINSNLQMRNMKENGIDSSYLDDIFRLAGAKEISLDSLKN